MAELTSFSGINLFILVVYLLALVWVGLRLAGKQNTTEDFFLGGRRMPWLAVAVSMFASLTSASSFLGVPGTAYRENISMVVIGLMSPVVAPILILLFYPFYRKLKVTTAYEYINYRYGESARMCVAGLFCLARLGWLGVVIYSPSLALSVMIGIDLYLSIFIMGVVATVYATLGGLSAVIWTDVFQFVFLVGGAVWVAFALVNGVPGGLSEIMSVAGETNHLAIWEWKLDLFEMTALSAAISYFFALMHDYGTDQVTVQRLMSVPDSRGMAKATILNSIIDLLLVSLLLFIGLGLFAYFQAFPERLPSGITGDRILPFYIIYALPNGVSGLLITAILAAAMSSLDSGINSLSSVILNDFVRPFQRRIIPHRQEVKLARILTLILGVFAIGAAFYTVMIGEILKASSAFLSLFGGPVLALFLLGMLTKRTHFRAWVLGTLPSLSVSVWLQNWTEVHFINYFPIAFGISFSLSYLVSFMMSGPVAKSELTVWGRQSV
ncbi:MAG: sodium/solute symporter [Acidobacteriia bacterium]|nr:sodium/solute symporter [Terriglobia bacterium]